MVANCPDSPTLQRFALGQLTNDALTDVAAHVEACPNCVQRLQQENSPDPILDALRTPIAEPDPLTRLVELCIVRRIETSRTGTISPSTTHPNIVASSADVVKLLAPPQAPDELGRLGSYRILNVLGQGGMGIVFVAEDTALKRKVALKTLQPRSDSPEFRQRFLREAQTAATIEHDHLVPIYQVGEEQGVPFFAMPLLKGETLEARLHGDRLALPEVLRLGREIALGLAVAHEHGLVHRDIKPANIFLENTVTTIGEPTTRVKILDFGLAHLMTDTLSGGPIVGTPAYMAPEQALGQHTEARSDLFSFGCVLYQLATKHNPFERTDTLNTLMAISSFQPQPPHERAPEIPVALSHLITSLLAKDPAQRPTSARNVVQALNEITSDLAAKPNNEPAANKARSRLWFGVVLAGLLFLGGTVIIILFLAENDGTLELTLNEPTALVLIDDQEPRIVANDGQGKIMLTLAPGKHRVRVQKEGFVAFTGEVLIEAKRNTIQEVQLVALPKELSLPLLFAHTKGGNYDIYAVSADGSQTKNLTQHPSKDFMPAWSPDGQRIAFISNRLGYDRLFVMNADGSNVRPLTPVSEGEFENSPAWSPDGTKMVFVRTTAKNLNVFWICVIAIDKAPDTEPTKVLYRGLDPVWSPDGTKIAFSGWREPYKGCRVFVMDTAGENIRTLSETDNPIGCAFPSWSPDSKKLAFTDYVTTTRSLEVHTHDFATGKNTQLTHLGGFTCAAVWSPDGNQMAFLRFTSRDSTCALSVMDADSKNVKALLADQRPFVNDRPVWRRFD